MADAPKRQGRGCFFYGTITFVLVLIGVMVGVFFGVRKGFKMAVAQYTSGAPVAIPEARLPQRELEQISQDLTLKLHSAMEGNGVGSVHIGERELNALVALSPESKKFSNQLYLQPEGNKLKAPVSVPLDQFEGWRDLRRKLWLKDLTNRYLNGTALVDLRFTNGLLNITITNLSVNNQSLPEKFMRWLEPFNLAEGVNKNAEIQPTLQRVKGVSVQNSQVVLEFNR